MERSQVKKLKVGEYYLHERKYTYRFILGFTYDEDSVYYITDIGYHGMCSKAHFVRKCPWICPKDLIPTIQEDARQFLQSLNK